MDDGIAKAQEKMERISRDDGLLHSYLLYEMTLSDETTRINGARREGEAIGMEKGRAKAREEGESKLMEEKTRAARRLKEKGVPVEIIAGSLDLSPEMVEGL
jgi:predicted transposase/invertase (TIGR01784 family)